MQSEAPPLRRSRRPTDTRRAILDAAEALLLEEGAEALTMRRLAERSGCTAPTLYHYFGDKRGLLDALLEEAFAGLLRELEAIPDDGDPLDVLRADFQALVRFGVENPQHYRVLLAVRPEDAEPLPSDEEARRRMEAPLERLFEQGRLRSPDLEPVRQALWALLHGLISLQTSRPDVEWAPDLTRLALDAMFAGLLRGDGEAPA
ncbi:MAG: TetR/AcrR family transcriptional regulator [Myxococcota bacterium]